MGENAKIRDIRFRDSEKFLNLVRVCWEVHNFPLMPQKSRADIFPRYGPFSIFMLAALKGAVVACVDDELVGYAAFGNHHPGLDHETGCLEQLYVHPDHCGRGIGKRLLFHIQGKLEDLGRPNMTLSCLAANDRARNFYIRQGGVEYCGSYFGSGESLIRLTHFGFGLRFQY